MPTTGPTKSNKSTHEETVIHVITSNPQQDHFVATVPDSSSGRKLPGLMIVMFLLIVGVGAYTLSLGNSTSGNKGSTASLLAAAPGQVSITGTSFIPATITVKVGQAVTWTNTDNAAHTVASDPYPSDNTLAALNSGQNLTAANDHYTYVFRTAGTYTYHDDRNPYVLEGTVIVTQ
jgi:plastocyanin